MLRLLRWRLQQARCHHQHRTQPLQQMYLQRSCRRRLPQIRCHRRAVHQTQATARSSPPLCEKFLGELQLQLRWRRPLLVLQLASLPREQMLQQLPS